MATGNTDSTGISIRKPQQGDRINSIKNTQQVHDILKQNLPLIAGNGIAISRTANGTAISLASGDNARPGKNVKVWLGTPTNTPGWYNGNIMNGAWTAASPYDLYDSGNFTACIYVNSFDANNGAWSLAIGYWYPGFTDGISPDGRVYVIGTYPGPGTCG